MKQTFLQTTFKTALNSFLEVRRFHQSHPLSRYDKPSYYLLSQAMDGDEKAIEKILAFYDPYISKCCLRPLYDEYGNVYIVVDTLKRYLVFFLEVSSMLLPTHHHKHEYHYRIH